MNVLLIEDETAVVSLIERGLSEKGLRIHSAPDGHAGLQMLKEYYYDVVILDLMLPGISGIDICRKIKETNVRSSILMLTALGTTENIVAGLDSGADDYMTKPFKLTELSARLNALYRRSNHNHNEDHLLRIADLVLDTHAKHLTCRGKRVALTTTEYRLLEFFIKNQNRVLSRMEILEHVWDIQFNLGTNVVDVYVNYLRKKIDRDRDQKLIHTMIGMGYIFKAK
ncbi:response regulator transcription factor [Sediminibacterium ginsengisoli]|uniref:DNA-binding response regulator, OmpR family, contains REC and winged-helix (WHTH) domain n=1 Tax=Sediminibacterium ginsengisoli TaxID=413434 RepID=A0A1T4N6D0_9BACT|nr:response regulator transcription factor [Sediminibacterium ginsengisoli]SJZ74829.1 DNA-binding response regulator, OmpR family, contains REC and winged-helix (wHTH) domain [Sediminibacterium ginsengisoli]